MTAFGAASLIAAWLSASAWAPDPSYEIYVTNEISGDLSLISGSTLKVEATVPLGKRPRGIEASADGKSLFVALSGNRVLTRIKVGMRPRAVAFTPDGAKAYVPGELDGSITIIDTQKLGIIGTIQLEGEVMRPMDAVISPDGRSLYLSTGLGRQVIHVDTRIDKVLREVTVGTRPWGLAVSPDGRRIFSANGPSNDVSVIDADSFKVIATIPVASGPWGIAVASRPSH